MYGGLERGAQEVSNNERSEGDSSSWKDFSTERRQKKLFMALKELLVGLEPSSIIDIHELYLLALASQVT